MHAAAKVQGGLLVFLIVVLLPADVITAARRFSGILCTPRVAEWSQVDRRRRLSNTTGLGSLLNYPPWEVE